MKNAGSTVLIDVDALRIGMFVHLDLGWMSHPFPLSSFRIASQEQIGIIRSLGLKKLRWSPEQSALAEAEERAAASVTEPAAQPAPELAAPAPDMAQTAALRERREALAAQRAALALCERQFAEASGECSQLSELVLGQPDAARDKAHALSRTMVDKMVGDGELCIRLLTEAAGDKAAAHALNVTLISLLMGRSFGLRETDLLDLGIGALLHDMGKLELPARARHREDRFTAAESKHYEEHVAHGVALALKMGLTPGATLVIAQHHEHADGSGFPLKLGHERMTPAASIVALVNRYDNLCNPQNGASALTPHEALSLLFAQGKSRYDTAILGGFIKMMGVYPPGSVVQLTDDRFAIVVGVNSTRPLKPRVRVHDPREPAGDAPAIDLEHTPRLGIRRSIRPQALPRDAYTHLAPRQRVAYFFEPEAVAHEVRA
ncbi:MAG TPA: HD domain-containing phosphohydrolase [Albitalea sp.]|nr:HD domain-containing phosphohydrolase [Albitalea sp.]